MTDPRQKPSFAGWYVQKCKHLYISVLLAPQLLNLQKCLSQILLQASHYFSLWICMNHNHAHTLKTFVIKMLTWVNRCSISCSCCSALTKAVFNLLVCSAFRAFLTLVVTHCSQITRTSLPTNKRCYKNHWSK